MRLKLLSLLFFVFCKMWTQTTNSFTTPGSNTFKVPGGVTSLSVECWGAGAAGGGVNATISVFGGGGGGGGAYSKVVLGATPAAVLNYTVGAGGVGVNGADGGNGQATTFSTVTANGGTGGKHGNSTYGAGGAGGIASGTGVIFSGGSGANARVVLGTLYSGGGGSSAGTGSNGNNAVDGTAGAAVTGGSAGGAGVFLGGGVGNPGGSPGSGGSGALGLLFSNFKGGNGGDGQIKVTYTCPVYSLTSTASADVCAATSTSTIVTLNGSTISLPVGDYVVTYSRSNPAATGLTAAMTVSTAGTGTFTASGLITTGSSTITVTRLTSESCFSDITTNNAITITVSPASVGGTVNGDTSICSGNTSGLLTLSGHTGAVSKWQYAVSPFSTWNDITNTASTYTSGTLTQTTQFRAVVQSGVCATANSAATTVTVNPLPVITTTGIVDDICFNAGAQVAILPYTATANTPISYSIVWSPAANTAGLINQGTTSFSFLAGGGNLNTIVIPAGIDANTYTGTMTITNANCSVTQPIQITIRAKPSAPTTGTVTEPTCILSTGSVILTGLPPSVTWLITQSGTASTTYTNTGTVYTVSNLVPGTYSFTVEYTGSCISSSSANVIINNLVTNTYNGSWSNGSPTINQNLVFAGNYSSTGAGGGNIDGCSCVVNSGVNVLINQNDTLTIMNSIVNNGGILTFENNASLLQITNTANTGDIVYKRISMPMKNFDYTYWSSPVAGQTLFDLSPNTLADKYMSYSGTNWQVIIGGTAVMQPGIGYIIRTPKAGTWPAPHPEVVAFPYSQPVQFRGVPNNGNITSSQSMINGNFYLIGNPYPSALNANDFLFNNANNSTVLNGTIYLWTHNTAIAGFNYSSDDYATYNGVGGIAISGGVLPSGYIAAGQSFLTSAKANGTVEFNNSMRVTGNNAQFFKPGKTGKTAELEKHRLWLNMTNTEGAFKQTLIGYVEGATNVYDDNFDGFSIDGNAYIDFYSINAADNLAIQGRALPFADTDVVSLGYRSTVAGSFTIAINQADGALATQRIYLEDKQTGTINELTAQNYTFSTTAGTFNNRFLLRYTNKTLGTADFETIENQITVVSHDKTIMINSPKEKIAKVFIYDVSGKQLYNQNVSNVELSISNLPFAQQVLLVKTVLENNSETINKLVFK